MKKLLFTSIISRVLHGAGALICYVQPVLADSVWLADALAFPPKRRASASDFASIAGPEI